MSLPIGPDIEQLEDLDRDDLDLDFRDETAAHDLGDSNAHEDDLFGDYIGDLQNAFSAATTTSDLGSAFQNPAALTALPSGVVASPTQRNSLLDRGARAGIDEFGDQIVLEEMLNVLETVVTMPDRRMYVLASSLKESKFPTRTNSTSAYAGSFGSISISALPKRRSDLIQRLFISDAGQLASADAILLRDLFVEEVKHCARLQTLQCTIVEPLEHAIKEGQISWMTLTQHHAIFHHFSQVASAQFDHTCTMARHMVEWPNTMGTSVLFQKWVFWLPLYADLAYSLHFATQQLLRIQSHPLSKDAWRDFMANRDEDPRYKNLPTVSSMSVPDLLNEPFNHLPKYQFFIESLLSHQAQYIFGRRDPSSRPISISPLRHKTTLPQPDDVREHFSSWCETLAILQQSLNYLTKAFQQSPKLSQIRVLVHRLGPDAPPNLKRTDPRKIVGGLDTLVYVTDHRRKRRKKGFAIIMSDCLLLVRCEPSDQTGVPTAGSPAVAATTLDSSTGSLQSPSTSAHGSSPNLAPVSSSNSQDDDTLISDPNKPGSAPLPRPTSYHQSLEPPQAKLSKKEKEKLEKDRKERERKDKLAELKAEKDRRAHPTSSANSGHSQPPASTSAAMTRSSSSGVATDKRGTAAGDFSSKPTRSNYSTPPRVNSSSSTRASTTYDYDDPLPVFGNISKSVLQSCPLRFIAMLFWDQVVIQQDIPRHDDHDVPALVVWAFDTKFTVEFEQQHHKEAWLETFTRQVQAKAAARPGPFGKTLSELYGLAAAGIPTSSERFFALDSFLTKAVEHPGAIQYMVPPFIKHLIRYIQSLSKSQLDGDMIIKAPVPPRHNSEWKALKKAVSHGWKIDFSQYPVSSIFSLLCDFLGKMKEPLIPATMVETISTQWDENDVTDPVKLAKWVVAFPPFNFYTLAYLATVFHSLVVDDGHVCPHLSIGSDPSSKPVTEQPPSAAKSESAHPYSVELPISSSPASLPASMIGSTHRTGSRGQLGSSTDGTHTGRERQGGRQAPPPMVFNNTASPLMSSAPASVSSSAPQQSNSAELKRRASDAPNPSTLLASPPTSAAPAPTALASLSTSVPSQDPIFYGAGPPLPTPVVSSHCDPTAFALLIAGALTPSLVRPFKLKSASATTVANFIGRLPRFVRLIASIIDHAPFLFETLTKLPPSDIMVSFANLRSSLEDSRVILAPQSTVSVRDSFYSGSSLQSASSPSSALSGSGPESTETARPKQKDTRRAAAIFHFDMSGSITETYSISDFSALHYAIMPPEVIQVLPAAISSGASSSAGNQ